ncbi:MAG: hypothetical protein ACKVT0_22485 [Planctomycetaceae bacterium]
MNSYESFQWLLMRFVTSLLCTYVATRKGYNVSLSLILSLTFGFLLAPLSILIALILPRTAEVKKQMIEDQRIAGELREAAKEMVCPQCGWVTSRASKFCPECCYKFVAHNLDTLEVVPDATQPAIDFPEFQ